MGDRALSPRAISSIDPDSGRGNSEIPSGALLQTRSVEIVVNTIISSVFPVYTTLLSLPITTTGGDLVIRFSMSGSAQGTLAAAMFRARIDGVAVSPPSSATSFLIGFLTLSCKMQIVRVPVGAGLHTVDIQYAGDVAAAMTILPTTAPFDVQDHGALVVQEVRP